MNRGCDFEKSTRALGGSRGTRGCVPVLEQLARDWLLDTGRVEEEHTAAQAQPRLLPPARRAAGRQLPRLRAQPRAQRRQQRGLGAGGRLFLFL